MNTVTEPFMRLSNMEPKEAFKQTLVEIKGIDGGVSYRTLIDRYEQLAYRSMESDRKRLRVKFGQWLQAYANNHPDRIKIIRSYNLSIMPNVMVV